MPPSGLKFINCFFIRYTPSPFFFLFFFASLVFFSLSPFAASPECDPGMNPYIRSTACNTRRIISLCVQNSSRLHNILYNNIIIYSKRHDRPLGPPDDDVRRYVARQRSPEFPLVRRRSRRFISGGPDRPHPGKCRVFPAGRDGFRTLVRFRSPENPVDHIRILPSSSDNFRNPKLISGANSDADDACRVGEYCSEKGPLTAKTIADFASFFAIRYRTLPVANVGVGVA